MYLNSDRAMNRRGAVNGRGKAVAHITSFLIAVVFC